ncbi:response regulator [candidate division NPL-UPA2 bacterium]|nr:response regulator [candidate division NPL-UPA2 bacterium]
MDRPEKVLVVDDDQEVRSSIEKILTRKGYQVTTVSSGHQALEEIAGASFSLVLLDMMMPSVSGFQVYQAIRLVPDLKVIIMTDPKEPAERMVEEVKKLGAQGTLLKPVGEKELLSIIESALRGRGNEVGS